MTKLRYLAGCLLAFPLGALAAPALPASTAPAAPLTSYVDPMIGSINDGNVTVGPARPFGMIRPGPDYSRVANSGYVAAPEAPLYGFSQLHVSGTGGGAKYGNISVMPFSGPIEAIGHTALREREHAELGYYGVTLKGSGIHAELTAASKAAQYRFRFPRGAPMALELDAGRLLNQGTVPLQAEAQYLVGSEIEVVSATEVRGHSRARGGWNNGGPYTVYFYARFDQPIRAVRTWKSGKLDARARRQSDTGEDTGALLGFGAARGRPLQMKIAISFLSSAHARENLDAEAPGWRFDAMLGATRAAWNALLSRVELGAGATGAQRRMFYTGLYHSMLMPSDRTGENPLWHSGEPYYDDFYAIWDTYRSSHPLIMLIDPAREAAIVRALIDIQRHEGFLPDARSGNANGRTQGGSNADVIIADAYVKGLEGIDYEQALAAMLADADVVPGGNEEKEGRGGLADYNTLGYVSSRYVRAGTRTVEYSLDDFAIATVARGLGHTALAQRFARQAGNWKHLWRAVEDHGARGFIMPRRADGSWIDEIACSVPGAATRAYAPHDVDIGTCVCWWCGFLYEGSSWEYSLAVPHDVAGLIDAAGGPGPFRRRLDTFFDGGFYNVGNEPSFLTPNLYHWLGRPDLSSARVRAIVQRHYHDGPDGIPGNDDSGAMSSWLVFRMLGLYPNAGQPVYLITSPLVGESTLHLQQGSALHIVARGFGAGAPYIGAARLNGKPLARAWITHQELEGGGLLELDMVAAASGWGAGAPPPSMSP